MQFLVLGLLIRTYKYDGCGTVYEVLEPTKHKSHGVQS